MTFDEFVAFRLGSLLRYATVLAGNPHEAEDVLQEVLVRAYGRWRRIAVVDRPEAYVRRMIVNELISVRRRVRARLGREHSGRTADHQPDPADRYVEHEALVRVCELNHLANWVGTRTRIGPGLADPYRAMASTPIRAGSHDASVVDSQNLVYRSLGDGIDLVVGQAVSGFPEAQMPPVTARQTMIHIMAELLWTGPPELGWIGRNP